MVWYHIDHCSFVRLFVWHKLKPNQTRGTIAHRASQQIILFPCCCWILSWFNPILSKAGYTLLLTTRMHASIHPCHAPCLVLSGTACVYEMITSGSFGENGAEMTYQELAAIIRMHGWMCVCAFFNACLVSDRRSSSHCIVSRRDHRTRVYDCIV